MSKNLVLTNSCLVTKLKKGTFQFLTAVSALILMSSPALTQAVTVATPPTVTPSTTQNNTFGTSTCSQQLDKFINDLSISALATDGAGLAAEIAAQVAIGTGIGLTAGAVAEGAAITTQAAGLAINSTAVAAQTEQLTLPNCDAQFTGTVSVSAGGANISGDSVFNNNLGVRGNLNVAGILQATTISSPNPITAKNVILGGNQLGIALGGGVLSGAGNGVGATTGDIDAVAIGNGANALTATSTALGTNSNANNINTLALGDNSQATGERSTAVGSNAFASATRSTAIGQAASATGSDSSAFGSNASALASRSTAVGEGALALGSGSVALGQGSVAGVANSGWAGTIINYKPVTNNATATSVVSVGGGAGSATPYRQITNVADGAVNATSTDAVNGSQLYKTITGLTEQILAVQREARQGIASAVAMTSAPLPSEPGKMTYTANTAFFRDEVAMGLAVAYRLDTRLPVSVTGGLAANSTGITAGRFGISGEF